MTATIAALGDHVEWLTAAPLWSSIFQSQGSIQRLKSPALLRFKSDSFMEDLIALLQSKPEQLENYIAQPESFRARPVGAPPDWTPPPPPQLKLYQPVHGFFYLIAATLVCHVPGFPDRTLNPACNEKVSFVLRRIGPQDEEMAWVNDPATGNKSWLVLTGDTVTQLAPSEELLPMFPLNFVQNGRKRRLFVGLIPTSSRESFQAGPALSPFSVETDQNGQPKDPRLDDLQTFVIEAIEKLKFYQAVPDEQDREASQFILLDFAAFLSTNLPALWNALKTSTPPAITDPAYALYTQLSTQTVDGINTWQVALLDAFAHQQAITEGGALLLPYHLTRMNVDITAQSNSLTQLYANVQTALGTYTPPTTTPANAPLPTMPKLDPTGATLYRLRCVYQRPCCGPLKPDVVSMPTVDFALAPFFDFDAPGRPVRITLPVDTSIAGLRKFNKNVAFLISNKLRQQMECASDLKKVMDGNLGCDAQFDLGTICSFSIPIITICALLVLFIFLILFNIVFWWLPFIRICFPIFLKKK